MVLALGVGLYLYLSSGKDGAENDQLSNSNSVADADINMNQNSEMKENADADAGLFDEDADLYKISDDSSVSYTAQKEFFSKPTEAITGVTNDVSGEASINFEQNLISLRAEINPQTLSTDSEKRDDYVREQFVSSIFVRVEDANFGEVNGGGKVSFSTPVKLMINNISKDLDFEIEGTISEEEINLSGSTSINLSDFEIEPASLAKVYTVNEVAQISFDISLAK